MIFQFVLLTGFGQDLTIQTSTKTNKKKLLLTLTITNSDQQTVYINTSFFRLATEPSDSTYKVGLLGILESDSGQFVPYSYPFTTIQMEDVREEARRTQRINKRQEPKIKISPSSYLVLEPKTVKGITIEVPLKYWNLSRGRRYKLILAYDQYPGATQLELANSQQVEHFRIETTWFKY